LDFRFRREFPHAIPDAYERLLLDAATGDASLFARNDEVELCWSVIDPILAGWQSHHAPPLDPYYAGQWGPGISNRWMRQQQFEWFDVCPVLH
jgi:glucose-6-phosphate 1-dehydrogenase